MTSAEAQIFRPESSQDGREAPLKARGPGRQRSCTRGAA
jgi:hypothetical protein